MNTLYKVIPTVFSIREENFKDRFERLLKISRYIHFDFMDGKFVKSKFLNFDLIPDLRKYKGYEFEAHLMLINPGKYISLLKNKGFHKIIFHFESLERDDIKSLIKKIKKDNMKAFIAVNPETKVHDYLLLTKELDGVMFMGVHPGKEHQRFIYDILEHVKELRHFNKKIKIQMDGGINEGNIYYIKKAGVQIFNTGSYVSESENPRKALKRLKDELN